MPQATTLQVFPRTQFRDLVGIKNSTLDQRSFNGELALAFGCERVAHKDEYTLFDACNTITGSMLHAHTGLSLKQTADILRTHWREWLTLLTRTETAMAEGKGGMCIQLFLCVAFRPLTGEHLVLMGELGEITTALSPYTTAPFFLSLALPLAVLRARAEAAGIDLPDRLTVAEDDPAHGRWLDEIKTYRAAAGVRSRRLAKA